MAGFVWTGGRFYDLADVPRAMADMDARVIQGKAMIVTAAFREKYGEESGRAML